MSRWNLAIAGTVAVGAVVVVAWVLLLPYTLGQTSSPSFISELAQRWRDGRAGAPSSPSLQPLLVEARARAAQQPGQQLVVDQGRHFSLVVPDAWQVASQVAGVATLRSASTTLTLLYPATTTEVLAGSTTTALELDGAPALLSIGTSTAQVVSQRSSGYAVISAAGPEAASLIVQLAGGVYLSQ